MRRRKRLWEIGKKPIVLAHRAGGNEALENSIDAFRAMADKGFTCVETDAHSTSDGVIVLFHDDVLDRTTDGTGRISDYTWAELKSVKDHSGNELVRLDTVLNNFPHLILNIDAKSWNSVEPLGEAIKQAGASKNVSLASFSERRLRRLRSMLPEAKSSLGTGAIAVLVLASRIPLLLGRLIAWLCVPGPRRGVEAVQIPIRYARINVLTPRFIKLCHKRGLAVHVWTINRASMMRGLLKMGVDGIITDEPTLAREVIDSFWAAR